MSKHETKRILWSWSKLRADLHENSFCVNINACMPCLLFLLLFSFVSVTTLLRNLVCCIDWSIVDNVASLLILFISSVNKSLTCTSSSVFQLFSQSVSVVCIVTCVIDIFMNRKDKLWQSNNFHPFNGFLQPRDGLWEWLLVGSLFHCSEVEGLGD